MKINTVDIVVVTYGNRWNLLSEVLKKIDLGNFGTINIVINGKSDTTKSKISKVVKNNNFIVSTLGENQGSAGGFRTGIEMAKQNSGEWCLLLDDDTFFETEELINFDLINDNKAAYSFYRESWAGRKNELNDVILKNSFFGQNFINKILPRKKNRYSKVMNGKMYCPYSGFLFPKEALKKIELPPEKMFLYVDDTFLTYSIHRIGYTIYECNEIELKDLEISWAKSETSNHIPTLKKIFYVDNPYRGLMNLRNRVYFEREMLIESKGKYFINMLIYLVIIFLFFMPKNKKGFNRFKQVLEVIKLGWRGELGSGLTGFPELKL